MLSSRGRWGQGCHPDTHATWSGLANCWKRSPNLRQPGKSRGRDGAFGEKLGNQVSSFCVASGTVWFGRWVHGQVGRGKVEQPVLKAPKNEEPGRCEALGEQPARKGRWRERGPVWPRGGPRNGDTAPEKGGGPRARPSLGMLLKEMKITQNNGYSMSTEYWLFHRFYLHVEQYGTLFLSPATKASPDVLPQLLCLIPHRYLSSTKPHHSSFAADAELAFKPSARCKTSAALLPFQDIRIGPSA